ncbi:glycoside hydrolase family 15 protein [Candidatus Gracilibacteria bacterium]|nr:glycoside hydrolase family 15 protein [Candidatus Gracilibacteria bacterium]
MSYTPINDHGLIGDLHTAGLVNKDGALVWLPWPRFDSPSLFTAILDHRQGGVWRIAPVATRTTAQCYQGETAVLVTTFETDSGRAELHDWMSPWEGPTSEHDLCRVLRCVAGTIEADCVFAPRPDYAQSAAALQLMSDGITFSAHGETFTLACSHPLRVEGNNATLRVILQAGEELRLILRSGAPARLDDFDRERELTMAFWQAWVAKGCYDGPWAIEVRRSAITLKLLTYAPSGAILAAPTTSLPEWIGGARNWDYRFTWLRDASLTLNALYRVGYRDEARAFFAGSASRAAVTARRSKLMYGIDGRAELTEETLAHLEGYMGSRPVRIGNGAYDQRQLDVYGGVLDAAWRYEREGELLEAWQWEILRHEIDYVCAHWHEPDHGIWEVRGAKAHFTFSKLMCWVALDRGILLADAHGWAYDRDRWHAARDTIRADLLAHGWSETAKAFTQRYGSDELDASMLVLPIVGFLPADDPRVASTVERIDAALGAGPLIYRYRSDDGLQGEEGAFLLCSFWMVDALILLGRLDEAEQRFEALLGYASAHGLLSEEADPATGTALGNYPQAFSHIGLINSAVRLARARQA